MSIVPFVGGALSNWFTVAMTSPAIGWIDRPRSFTKEQNERADKILKGGFPGSKGRKAYEEQANQQRNNLLPPTDLARNMEGGLSRCEVNNHTLTTGAAATFRTQLASDIYANLWSTWNTEDDKVPMLTKMKLSWTMTATVPFLVWCWAVLLEPGDTISSNDSTGYDVNAAIEASVTGQDHAVKIFSMKEAQLLQDITTWGCRMQHDLSAVVADYFTYCNKQEIQEETYCPLQIGLTIYAPSNTTVTVKGFKHAFGFQQPRGSSLTEVLK
jgi:hypothetical protein